LYGIADQKKKNQVKRCHLANFALAAQPDPKQNDEIDDRRPQDDIKQDMAAGKHTCG
jgi:hypothetical protein